MADALPPLPWRRAENEALVKLRTFMDHLFRNASAEMEELAWGEVAARLSYRGFARRTWWSYRDQVEELVRCYRDQGKAAPLSQYLSTLVVLLPPPPAAADALEPPPLLEPPVPAAGGGLLEPADAGPWTGVEIINLIEIKAAMTDMPYKSLRGMQKWDYVSEQLAAIGGIPRRTAVQCREKWRQLKGTFGNFKDRKDAARESRHGGIDLN